MSDEVPADDTPKQAWDRWLRSRGVTPRSSRTAAPSASLDPAALSDASLDAMAAGMGGARRRVEALEAEHAAAVPAVERIAAALAEARTHHARVVTLVRQALTLRAGGVAPIVTARALDRALDGTEALPADVRARIRTLAAAAAPGDGEGGEGK